MIKKVYGTPKKVPGISGKGIAIFGKPAHNVAAGHVSDIKIGTLKGNPWSGGQDMLSKIAKGK